MKVAGAENKPTLQEVFDQHAAIQRDGAFPFVNLIIGDHEKYKCEGTQEEEQR
jgi:hypothetical protein